MNTSQGQIFKKLADATGDLMSNAKNQYPSLLRFQEWKEKLGGLFLIYYLVFYLKNNTLAYETPLFAPYNHLRYSSIA
jgi:hypothetical protein